MMANKTYTQSSGGSRIVERKGNNKNTQTSVAGKFVSPKTPTDPKVVAKIKQSPKKK